MKSNYDILGNHIRLIDTRNRESITDRVLGINIDKFFMPSVANVIGTDLSKYKLITKGKFACNPMHVGRDERLPVALYDEEEPAIVSPAYFMFEVVDNSILNEDYLMMWFRRPEFDRICWLHTDGSVRGGITWDDICRLELPIPPIEKQLEIVNSYKAITERIALKKKINDNLEATANMSPAKFEQFSRALLTKMGVEFTNKGVQVSNDGGIDGYGYHVDADDFRTTRVVIQCKRFNSNPVNEPDINQFLGAMNKYQADYGVFITNSRFTNKAREAAREGTPITLIDGNDLIRLVIKYELYITPVTTYVLDGFYTED